MKSKSKTGIVKALTIATLLVHVCILFSACSSSSTAKKEDGKVTEITVQLNPGDVLSGAAVNPSMPELTNTIEKTDERFSAGEHDYVTVFVEEFHKLYPTGKLSALFPAVSDRMNDSVAIATLRREIKAATDNAVKVLDKRLDYLDLNIPEIDAAKDVDGRLEMKLRGAVDTKQVSKLIEGHYDVGFYETYTINEIQSFLERVANLAPSTKGLKQFKKMLATLEQSYYCTLGYVNTLAEVDSITEFMNSEAVRSIMPSDFKILWSFKPERLWDRPGDTLVYCAYALKTYKGRGAMDGNSIVETDVAENDEYGFVEISLEMNSRGAIEWENLTKQNTGRAIAIVVGDGVCSAPVVNEPITGGRSSITRDFTEEEAYKLACLIKSGSLGARAKVIAIKTVED